MRNPLTTRTASALAALLLFASSRSAHAEETSNESETDTFSAHRSGVTLGASGGVAMSGGADAGGSFDSRVRPSLHVYGGYRFTNGFSPELAILYQSSVASLSPGLRWSLPIEGRLQPWVGAHGGVAHVTLASSDVVSGYTYWSVDAGAGLDLRLTRAVSFGIAADWTYANAMDAPRSQPLPAGVVGAPEPSYAIDWMTLRAGFGVVL